MTVLLHLAGLYAGPFSAIFNLLIALPAAFVHMVCGAWIGAGAIVIAAGGIFANNGLSPMLGYLLQFGLGSFLLPFLLRRRFSWDRAVIATAAFVIAISVGSLAAYTAWEGKQLGPVIDSYIQQEVDTATHLTQQAKLPADQMDEVKSMIGQMGAFLKIAYPSLGFLVIAGILLLQVVMLAALSRGRYVWDQRPFQFWKAPELLIWALIIGGFAFFLGTGITRTLGVNLLIALLPIYFLQGLAVVSHFFWRRRVPPAFRTFGYLLLTLLNPFPLIVTGIGIFDLWADFRKPKVKKT